MDAELQFKVFQNVGTHTNQTTTNDNSGVDSYGIDLQMIFVVVPSFALHA